EIIVRVVAHDVGRLVLLIYGGEIASDDVLQRVRLSSVTVEDDLVREYELRADHPLVEAAVHVELSQQSTVVSVQIANDPAEKRLTRSLISPHDDGARQLRSGVGQWVG